MFRIDLHEVDVSLFELSHEHVVLDSETFLVVVSSALQIQEKLRKQQDAVKQQIVSLLVWKLFWIFSPVAIWQIW